MNWLTIIVIALLLSLVISEPCEFIPEFEVSGIPFGVHNAETIEECFQAISLPDQRKSQTLAQLRNLIRLYSFTDIAQNSPPPYNLQIGLEEELNRIESTEYSNDFEFHNDLNMLFNQLGDAHTIYVHPAPYLSIVLLHPFFLGSIVNGETQTITVLQETSLGRFTYSRLTGISVSEYVGRNIVTINGQPAVSWLSELGKRAGTSKDSSVHFNLALLNVIPLSEINELGFPAVPNFEFEFEGGTTLELPASYLVIGTFVDVEDFSSQIPFENKETRSHLQLPKLLQYWASGKDPLQVPFDPLKEKKKRMEQLLSGDGKILTTEEREAAKQKKKQEIAEKNKKKENESKDEEFHQAYKIPRKTETLLKKEYIKEKHRRQDTSLTLLYQTSDQQTMFCYEHVDANDEVTTILQITSFAPFNQLIPVWLNSFFETLDLCLQNSKANRLLLDVQSNGGGIVCVSQITPLWFITEWDNPSSNQIFEPYDLRKSNLTDELKNKDILTASNYGDPTTVPATPFENDGWYSPSVEKTRGNQTSEFTPKSFFLPECVSIAPREFGKIKVKQFSQILIVTDGLCGSACSYFITKLRYHGKAALLGHGGILNQSMETSSFAGGNVEDWPAFVQTVDDESVVAQLPTTAFTRFNFHQLYLGNEEIPREFQRYEPDFRIVNFPSNPENLWNSAIEFFGQFKEIEPLGPYFLEEENTQQSINSSSILSIPFLLLLFSFFHFFL